MSSTNIPDSYTSADPDHELHNNKDQLSNATTTNHTKKRRHTGVGVLIITEYMGNPYLVLGREEYKSIKQNGQYMIPLYEEFGGGIQRRKLGLELNACFELREETCNLLNFTSSPDVLLSGVNRYFDIPFREDRMYRLYVVFIPDFVKLLPYFYMNRTCLQRKTRYPGGRLNTYLEMDNIKLVSLDSIKNAIDKSNNYICFNHEDTLWNYEQNKPYRGTLRVDDDTFISERLCQFLNSKQAAETEKVTGLDACYNIYDTVNNQEQIDSNSEDEVKAKHKVIKLAHPQKHMYNPDNTYDNFLVGTYYIAPEQV
jgi:hypothetical protein